ncbi:hypothetical protein [Ralstonia pickettii]|uniref:MarR family transcriptional regulator n=1 Tax=Ralstonia pickettii TaxID=329 RepID=A0AAW4Q759_RALPI|nr:hypothetical protein [Ralstonia pickettii]MBA9846782.1 hypothetical protein [Ralstonia pickettii]MBA9852066.1 hypothetical protein [Ralstonia pickettii]MBA9919919.1 hypothetical protein [Ralstonia pickettii]MBA9959021.1 hypothetical protein [Ralstonia pickettii]MBA9964600.1 hypothetical protein [Ralstonia pickettii]
MLLHYETVAEAQAAAFQLERLGGAACRLLEQCVEAQALKRTKPSKTALRLSDAGFLFIRETGDLWRQDITLLPSLAGEEALDALDHMHANKRAIVGLDDKDHQ